MQRYMKSEMPFHGVQAPAQKRIFRQIFKQYPMANQAEWHAGMLDLWRNAGCREERYGAIALSAVRPYRVFQDVKSLAVYEEMIVTGAWWDFVDSLSGRLGELLLDFPARIEKKMVRWATDKNLWKRRSSIILQLKLKETTNSRLLFDNITANMADREFFIRKAIGWALREYGKTSAAEVIEFVTANRARLSPLSKKEALRVLVKQGVIQEQR